MSDEPPGAPVSPDLSRLAWKYETLGELRRARERGEPVPGREVFRRLAAEFPGCLMELDTFPLEEIDARAAALRHAAQPNPDREGGDRSQAEPWMLWLAGYHALLRAALWLKPRVARRPPDDAGSERLAADASASTGVPVDAAFVRAVASPPGGRIVAVVLATLAERHGRPAAVIRRAIHPFARR